jgi:hypothetical protein
MVGIKYIHSINPAEGIKRGDIMKLSTKGRYGLRAVLDLAVHEDE